MKSSSRICFLRRLFFNLLWLLEDQEAAQFADIKTRICFPRSREGYPAITNYALEGPVKSRLKLLIGPNIIDLSLFGLTGSLAAAAHLRYIRFSCHVAIDTTMANG